MTSATVGKSRSSLTTVTIADALDGLLRAIFEHEARQEAARVGPRHFEFLTIADLKAECLPSRAESAIMEMARDPIGAACRQAVRRCGEMLFERGGFDLMQTVIEDVADRDPGRYGARATIVDHSWNGIAEVWWA